jgi:hypothetical protein
MATIQNFKIDGVPHNPPRNVKRLVLSAVFGFDNRASVSVDTLSFVNTDYKNTSDVVRSLFETKPYQGFDYTFEVTNGNTAFAFDFFADYSTLVYKSGVETEVGMLQDKSLDSLLDLNGEDVTMGLLDLKNAFTFDDFIQIPYVIENRKTVLERLQLLAQFYVIIKTGVDEVFKIINIASDLTSFGIVQATANLVTTVANLGLLFIQLTNLLSEIRDAFFPPIRYHSGIALKNYVEKACAYLGYSVDFGNVWTELSGIGLCPSKNDEIGSEFPNPLSKGILKPSDFGYNLKDLFELCRKLGNARIAVVGNTIHIKPKNDPYWSSTSGFIFPDVIIEDSVFTSNGTKTFNFNELYSSTTVEYATDDSDYWTIQRFATDTNGDRISVAQRSVIGNADNRKVNIGKPQDIKIPYALCVRKDTIDDLVDLFFSLSDGLEQWKLIIESAFGSVNEAFPILDTLSLFTANRDGSMKVENHFFSTPKLVYLENGKIPENFNEKIGAKAIYQNRHYYDSFVGGVRNPNNLSDTNAKEIMPTVKIPMNIDDFSLLLNNPSFTTQQGVKGEFTKIDWDSKGDFATVDYWLQKNWLIGVKEEIL